MAGDRTVREAMERLVEAMRQHDVDALMDLFGDDYDSEQPLHPARHFRGAAQVRKNWSAMFSEIPDFKADLIRSTIDQDIAWSEWHWTGTARSGRPMDEMGVALFGFREGKVAWARLYIEPVE